MQYEIYLDKLFIMNFIFNGSILFLTKTFLKLQIKISRVAVSALIGAAGFCSAFILPFPPGTVRLLWLLLIVYPSMIVFLCWKKSKRTMISCGVVTALVALLLGKIIEFACMGMFEKSFFKIVCFGIVVSCFLYFLGKIYIGLCEEEERYYTVQITYQEKSTVVCALYDTGNLLKDPITGRCVHIIDRETAKSIGVSIGEAMEYSCKIRLIPYRTIANTGLIPVFSVTRIKVSNERANYVIQNPLLGVSGENFSSNQKYHMILNAGELN